MPGRIHSEGLRPSDSPTRSLASRFVGSLRSRGSLRFARSRLPSDVRARFALSLALFLQIQSSVRLLARGLRPRRYGIRPDVDAASPIRVPSAASKSETPRPDTIAT